MNFAQAIESCFKNYFTFTGRAPRSEYIYWVLFTSFLSFVVTFTIIIATGSAETGEIVGNLLSLILLPAYISAGIRRFHDIGKSGWNSLWSLTIIGVIAVVYWTIFKKGDSGKNQYGQNPLKKSNDSVSSVDHSNYSSSESSPINLSDQLVEDDVSESKSTPTSTSYKKGGLYD